MRIWRNVKSNKEMVELVNELMKNDIKFVMEHNHDKDYEIDFVTIVVTSRIKDKLDKCFEIGFLKD